MLEFWALVLGFYMAWNIGANDVANAMGTSVGSKALTMGKAVILAAVLEFAGAFFAGGNVTNTIQHGILHTEIFSVDPAVFVLGMLSVLLSTGLLLQAASYFALPVSTTHAIVGSVVGFGWFVGGVEAVAWKEVGWISLSWICSPLLSGAISYCVLTFLRKTLRAPVLAGAQYTTAQRPEKVFIYLQICSASLVAFAHGANDVSNAIGPVAAIFSSVKTGAMHHASHVPLWLLAFGGFGMVAGLATWGWRVIETVGKKITELTPMRGFAAEFGTAITVLFASKLGLPISTTHALVGSIVGVGLAQGAHTLNFAMFKGILASWLVTLPLCSLCAISIFYALSLFVR